ncbi:MAG: hypothetical protein RRY19_09740 [Clostridium sp.]
MQEIVKHQNNFFELNKETAACRHIQIPQDQEVKEVKEVKARYFVYLVNDTEEFKGGKAIFFDSLGVANAFYNKKVFHKEYNYIDIGIEIDEFFSYILKRKERE